MSDRPSPTSSPTIDPPEVSLLLRAHAEQRWLSCEVLPVVDQLETGEDLPEEQLPAALAYLEVTWWEAVRRAGDTDGACTRLELSLPAADPTLAARARGYRAAVVVLREAVGRRVAPLLAAPCGEEDGVGMPEDGVGSCDPIPSAPRFSSNSNL